MLPPLVQGSDLVPSFMVSTILPWAIDLHTGYHSDDIYKTKPLRMSPSALGYDITGQGAPPTQKSEPDTKPEACTGPVSRVVTKILRHIICKSHLRTL
jgi:hypothetical protein